MRELSCTKTIYRTSAARIDVTVTTRETDKGVELAFQGAIYRRNRSNTAWREWSVGQCQDTIRQMLEAHPDGPWDADTRTLLDNWDRWHLNGMRAGCEHQRALGWKVCPGHYTDTTPDLARANADLRRDGVALVHGSGRHFRCGQEGFPMPCGQPDRLSQPCPTCGYKYGSQWLFEPLSDAVKQWVRDNWTHGTVREGLAAAIL